jgi:hypothetical protein
MTIRDRPRPLSERPLPAAQEKHMAFRYQLRVIDGSRDQYTAWRENGVVFPTHEEAKNAGIAKMMAWTLVSDMRVVETDEPANYHWIPGRGLQHIPGED